MAAGQASFALAFGILVWSDVRFQAGADLSIRRFCRKDGSMSHLADLRRWTPCFP
ncbi:hypothetical protein [Rhizobium mongolense]|uniref:Uncharacterized protein n=1 Tax=Rhizobium mongolense TaxID=57676 RepID=A0A7W6RRV7_9HYPH|nr:hypothetical protein [Rhizobium mongolense]MBB4277509.1 hypothetical protein [Rhizobium mongolense]